MWKLLTEVSAEEMYDYLEREKLLPEEQNVYRWGCRETKDQLLIDKTVERLQKKHTNLFIAWIDYKKAYDFAPLIWINECILGSYLEFHKT